MTSTLHFDVFNPRYLTHWLVAAYQLAKRERYWWVVHVTTKINELELYLKFNTISLVEPRQHDRELLWYPLSQTSERVLMLYIQSKYWVNCSHVVSCCTDTKQIYFTPASLFEAALEYTDGILRTHDTNITNIRTSHCSVSVSTDNN